MTCYLDLSNNFPIYTSAALFLLASIPDSTFDVIATTSESMLSDAK